MSIVIVTGGRNYARQSRVNEILDAAIVRLDMKLLVQGGAKGLDTLAWKWAASREFPNRSFPADWDKHGRNAGPIRNIEMAEFALAHPDPVKICIAFPGGNGTADMIFAAWSRGFRIIEVDRK